MIGSDIPVPYPNIVQCVKTLDDDLLGHIAAKAWEAAKVLEDFNTGDPLRKISSSWYNSEVNVNPISTLLAYGLVSCKEYESRHRANNWVGQAGRDLIKTLGLSSIGPFHCVPVDLKLRETAKIPSILIKYRVPSWWGISLLHKTHRNLLSMRSVYRIPVQFPLPNVTVNRNNPHDYRELDMKKEWK